MDKPVNKSLNMDFLKSKNIKVISTEEALRDIIPYDPQVKR